MQAKSIRSQKRERAPIGYWAAQEQYSLQDLLNHIVQAEKAGFTSTMTSDHFHPWWHDNGFGNLLGYGLLQQLKEQKECNL